VPIPQCSYLFSDLYYTHNYIPNMASPAPTPSTSTAAETTRHGSTSSMSSDGSGETVPYKTSDSDSSDGTGTVFDHDQMTTYINRVEQAGGSYEEAGPPPRPTRRSLWRYAAYWSHLTQARYQEDYTRIYGQPSQHPMGDVPLHLLHGEHATDLNIAMLRVVFYNHHRTVGVGIAPYQLSLDRQLIALEDPDRVVESQELIFSLLGLRYRHEMWSDEGASIREY